MLVYQLFVLFAGAMSLFYSPSAREVAYDFVRFCLEESSVPASIHEVQFLNPLLLAVEYFREPPYHYGELMRDISIYMNTTHADTTTGSSDATPFTFDWYMWSILTLAFLFVQYTMIYAVRLLTKQHEPLEEPVVENTYWFFVADSDANPYTGTIYQITRCFGMPQRMDLIKFDFSSFTRSASFNYGSGATSIPGLDLPQASRQQLLSASLSTAATPALVVPPHFTSSTSAASSEVLELDNRFEEIVSVSDEDDAEEQAARDGLTTPATSTLYNISLASSEDSSYEHSPHSLEKQDLVFDSHFVDTTMETKANTIAALDLCTGASSLVNQGESGAGPDATANCDLSAVCDTVGSVGYLDLASLVAPATDDLDYAPAQAEPEVCPPSHAWSIHGDSPVSESHHEQNPGRSLRRRHSVSDIHVHCMIPVAEDEAHSDAAFHRVRQFIDERITSTIYPDRAPPAAVVADQMAALAPDWQAYVVGETFDYMVRYRWMAGPAEEVPPVFDTLRPWQ